MAGSMKRSLSVLVVTTWLSLLGSFPVEAAQVHHVVGGDRGWDSSSDVGSWSSGRLFRVGDQIWFTYSAAEESVAELGSKEEFMACDLSNPIRMYTDGLNNLFLDGEGTRYFTSGKPHNCKNGLKLNVEVLPQSYKENPSQSIEAVVAAALATGPTPSASAPLQGVSLLIWVGLAFLFYVVL